MGKVEKLCSAPGCFDVHCANGYCCKHNHRFKRYGAWDGSPTPRIAQKGVAPCTVLGCGKRVVCRGLCYGHYNRLRKYGSTSLGSTSPGELTRYFHEEVLPYEGDECLTWVYTKNPDGYGMMTYKGRATGAHRAVCIELYGPPPSPIHQAAHSCGNGHLGCVNKRHLSWKTPVENSADALLHGTRIRGEKSPVSKLKEQEVIQIKAMLKRGETKPKIAKAFSVHPATIQAINEGRSWAWLK